MSKAYRFRYVFAILVAIVAILAAIVIFIIALAGPAIPAVVASVAALAVPAVVVIVVDSSEALNRSQLPNPAHHPRRANLAPVISRRRVHKRQESCSLAKFT